MYKMFIDFKMLGAMPQAVPMQICFVVPKHAIEPGMSEQGHPTFGGAKNINS